MDHVIYLQANGEILRSFSGPLEDVVHQVANGEAAVHGCGSWLTHKVVDGQVVVLPSARVPPFEGAAWDAVDAAWFDPLQRADTAAAARVQRRALLVSRMAQAEQRQARPMREIQVAQALGNGVPAPAIATLHAIELEIAALRTQLVALA